MIYLALIFIILHAYIELDSYWDFIKIHKRKKYVNYNYKIIQRSIVFSGLIVAHFFLVSDSISINLLFFINMCFSYWYFFDLGLNTRRNLNAEYIGENSKLDLRLKSLKIKHKTIFVIKKWLFIVSCIVYFLCWL